MSDLLAGAARLSLEPPLDLPLVGFVRQTHDATGYGRFGLETSAIALEQDGLRVVLCGVDIVGIGEPEITRAPRPGRGGDRRRPGRDPAQLEPHAPLRDRRLLGRRADRAAGARSATRGSGASPTSSRTRSSRSARSRSSGSSRPGRCGASGTPSSPVNRRERAAGRDDDPRLEPGQARRQPGHLAPAPPARRERRRDRGQLRLPSGHDRLRHVRLLRRLPGAAARRRAAQHRRRGRLPPGCRAATSCRRSRSRTTRTRPS